MNTTRSAIVIDDDRGFRQSMRLCLETDDARVMTVGISAAALEAVDRSWFDVVLLDLWLQSESCLTVLPEILRRQSGIGVIVITAFASFESAVEAMRLARSTTSRNRSLPTRCANPAGGPLEMSNHEKRLSTVSGGEVGRGPRRNLQAGRPSVRRQQDDRSRVRTSCWITLEEERNH